MTTTAEMANAGCDNETEAPSALNLNSRLSGAARLGSPRKLSSKFDFGQGSISMVFQPCGDFHLNFLDMLYSITHESAAEHRRVRPGHNHLNHVMRLINSARFARIFP